MQTVSVLLSKIDYNPWRDLNLFPTDKVHIQELMASIDRHGFFGGIKARPVADRYQAGCGVHRISAAREAGLKSIEIMVGEIDDDEMLNLMVTENGTQSGGNAAAAMNDVAAVTRRIIYGLLGGSGTIVPEWAFETKHAIDIARGRLLKRREDPDADAGVGYNTVIRYLGHGDPKASPRHVREVRDAIETLKQSGKYDDIIDAALTCAQDDTPTDGKTITVKRQATKPRKRILDEKCAAIFANDHQFSAFKEAITTEAAQRFIPVNAQMELAEAIVAETHAGFKKRQQGAPFIKAYVNTFVREAAKQQRDINEQEKQEFLAQQVGLQIKAEVRCARASARSLLSSCLKLERLWKEAPGNVNFGDIGGTLDSLAKSIEQMRKTFRTV